VVKQLTFATLTFADLASGYHNEYSNVMLLLKLNTFSK